MALERTGSPYAVTPGTLTTADGTPYRVYSPFFRAWQERGVHSPATNPRRVAWTDGGVRGVPVPDDPDLGDVVLPPAGELGAREMWDRFRQDDLGDYASTRNRPDLDRTSLMSVYLKYGCLHPRTTLADLADGGTGADAYAERSCSATSTPTCCTTGPTPHGTRCSRTWPACTNRQGIVDHAVERRVALERFAEVRGT